MSKLASPAEIAAPLPVGSLIRLAGPTYMETLVRGTDDQEHWASQFICDVHGRCCYGMVTTKKTCYFCKPDRTLTRYESI